MEQQNNQEHLVLKRNLSMGSFYDDSVKQTGNIAIKKKRPLVPRK